MLVIRLFRVGKKNQPSYKIVVTDKRKAPHAGRFVEVVGFYNPLTKEKAIKGERVKYWISVGAKPSPTVHNLLINAKVIEGKKIPKHKYVPKAPVVEVVAQEPAHVEQPAAEEIKPAESPVVSEEKAEGVTESQ